jgi:hypothetical protein
MTSRILLSLLCLALPARGAVTVVPAPTSGGFAGGPPPSNAAVWDNFEGPNIIGSGVFARWELGHTNALDKQNYTYSWFLGDPTHPEVTNQLSIVNGKLGFRDDIVTCTNAVYFCVSNNTSQPFTKIGGWISYTNAGPGVLSPGFVCAVGAILCDRFGFVGDWLHSYHDGVNCFVQRALAENVIFENLPSPGVIGNGSKIFWELQCVSNSITAQIGNWRFSGTQSNANVWAKQPVAICELNGAGGKNYQYQFAWDTWWAGYADQGLASDQVIGTNMSSGQSLRYRPALTTNTYLSLYLDSVIAMGPPGTATTVVTNKLPPVGTNPGKLFTIYDSVGMASGSNIWILINDGGTGKFSGGPTRTNISSDFGSITLMGSPTGYQVLSKWP